MGFDSLIRFGNQIGLGKDELSKAEKLHRFYLKKIFSVKELKNISISSVEELRQNFGNALSLRIGDDNDGLSLIEKGKTLPCLKAKLQRIAGLVNTMELRLELKIEKKMLLRKLGFTGEQYHSLLYIFKNKLIKFISSPLPALDEHLFSDPYKPAIVVLYEDTMYHYSGTFLTIVGVDAKETARNDLSPIGANVKNRIEKFHTTATNSLNWKGFEFKNLTPLHFLCDRKSGTPCEISTVICNHLLHLCILYTANRSIYEKTDKKFQVTFTSSNSERTLIFSNESGSNTIAENQRLLSQLAMWPYSGKEDERLDIFQTVVTREFDSDEPKKNYDEFCSRLKQLLHQARWHYKVFIEGKINKHFEQVQKVTDYVVDVAKEVAQNLDSITKGFTDTLLASIGIIVLTMLASLIKKETQGDLFKVAMWAYAGYLCIFQLFYRLGSIAHSYYLLKKGTKERLDEYSSALGRKKVEDLTSPLERRKRQFWIWFVLTIVAYIAVIILILILADKGPKIWHN